MKNFSGRSRSRPFCLEPESALGPRTLGAAQKNGDSVTLDSGAEIISTPQNFKGSRTSGLALAMVKISVLRITMNFCINFVVLILYH